MSQSFVLDGVTRRETSRETSFIAKDLKSQSISRSCDKRAPPQSCVCWCGSIIFGILWGVDLASRLAACLSHTDLRRITELRRQKSCVYILVEFRTEVSYSLSACSWILMTPKQTHAEVTHQGDIIASHASLRTARMMT